MDATNPTNSTAHPHPDPGKARGLAARRALAPLAIAAATLAGGCSLASLAGCSTANTRVTGETVGATHTAESEGPSSSHNRVFRLRFPGEHGDRHESSVDPNTDPSDQPERPESPLGARSDAKDSWPTPATETPGDAKHSASASISSLVAAAIFGVLPSEATSSAQLYPIADPDLVPTPLPSERPGSLQDRIDDDTLARMIDAAAATGRAFEVEVIESGSSTGGSDSTVSTLTGQGPAVSTTSGAGEITTDGGLGDFDLPWGGSWSVGGLRFDAEIMAKAASSPLVWIGGLVLIASVIPLLLPPRRLLDAAAIAGVGLITIGAGVVHEQYPFVFLIAMAALLGLLVYLAWRTWRAAEGELVLDAVVPAVESSEDAEFVKDTVAVVSGRDRPVVRRGVRRAKKRTRLESAAG